MIAPLLLVSVPVLTALALAALRSDQHTERIDRWVVTLALPLAIGLAAWTGGLDRLGLLSAVLVWTTAALARWGRVTNEGTGASAPAGTDGDSAEPGRLAGDGSGHGARALEQVALGGLLLVCLSGGSPSVTVWAAVAVVVGVSMLGLGDTGLSPSAPSRKGRGGVGIAAVPWLDARPTASLGGNRGMGIAPAGLLLAVFGTIAAPLDLLLGLGCQVIGLAILLTLVPALLPVALPLLLRLGTEAGAPLLLAAGLAGLVLSTIPRSLTAERGAVLGQIGLAAAAIGLGNAEGAFAALILLILLTLTDAASRLTDRTHPLALLGLAGLPPLGTFAGLALVLPAIAGHAPWLLLICLPCLATSGWRLIRRATNRRAGPWTLRALGWLPIAAVLILGLLMPAPLALWLRAALPPPALTEGPAR